MELESPLLAVESVEAPQVARWPWLVLGVVNIGLAVLGAMLPVMPSTVFGIAAAACFARSSPKLERRVLEHPTLGPSVLAWRREGAIPLRGKMAACAGMSVSMGLVLLKGNPTVSLIVFAVLAASAAYVLSRPTATR